MTTDDTAAQIAEIRATLEGMQAALRRTESYPTDIDRATNRVTELVDQKLLRVSESVAGMKELITAQNAAQKASVEKTEELTTARLEAQANTVASLERQIIRREGNLGGVLATWAFVAAVVALIATAITIYASVPKEPRVIQVIVPDTPRPPQQPER